MRRRRPSRVLETPYSNTQGAKDSGKGNSAGKETQQGLGNRGYSFFKSHRGRFSAGRRRKRDFRESWRGKLDTLKTKHNQSLKLRLEGCKLVPAF